MEISSLNHVSEFTPQTVDSRLFSIPLYQRLYAWETEQIRQLLDDLHDTYLKFKDNRKDYFIGNIVKASLDKFNRNALIDGQQRITTLWLMGFVLKEFYSEWDNFIKINEFLRLDFIARKDDKLFLDKLSKTSSYNEYIQKEFPQINPKMKNAIEVVHAFFDNEVTNKPEFAKYIYKHAKFVEVTLPDKTNLNKYFEIMNNRGIQLEKHEILKARILNKIGNDKQVQYSKIWDACSQMNRFIENCFEKEEQNIKIKDEIYNLIESKFSDIGKFIERISDGDNKNDKTLTQIIEEASLESNPEISYDQIIVNEDQFYSIINFSTFLLHAYKVHKKDSKVSLKDKDLLKNINIQTEDEAIAFIKDVFIFRILFDQYIIKNYRNGLNNLWETRILKIEEDKAEQKKVRIKSFENTTQILAMLNVSTSVEHWLPPALSYLRRKETLEDESLTHWLEDLDNYFAYLRQFEQKSMMKSSNNLLSDIGVAIPRKTFSVDVNKLSKGTSTDHYWFYKLDYCLWKKWLNDDSITKWSTEIRSYQFRSNRSIEHVYPQHPEDENYWEDDVLNSFGNLALISVGSNSEYNRHGFLWKKGQFKDRIAKKWGIESLKLADIYNSREEWTSQDCARHQEDMINILNNYHQNERN
jgi:hypothetical protein